MENLVKLITAANALVKALDEIQDSPEYRGIWQTAAAHGVRYQGRQWKNELDELRSRLTVFNEQRRTTS